MYMKRILILLAAPLLLLACGKPKEDPKPEIQIAVTEIGSRNATVTVKTAGPAPALVRLTDAILKEEFPSDESTLPDFLKTNGSAVSVPYTSALKDLFPSTAYVIGAISFDGNMDVLTWNTVEFRTEDLGTSTIGDPSDAGTVTENELEDKPQDEGGE